MKILFRIQTVSGNPKSEIQNPKSKIQDPKSKIQALKSKIQTALLDFGFWSLDFGFGVAGLGPEAMAMQQTMLYGQSGHPKLVAGSVPPTRAPNWAPVSGGGFCWKPSPDFRPRVVEIGAQFPEKRRASRQGTPPTLGVQPFDCGHQNKATNCMPQSFIAIPVESKMELSMFVLSRVLDYVEAC